MGTLRRGPLSAVYRIRIRAIIRSGSTTLLRHCIWFSYIIMLYGVFLMFGLLGFSYITRYITVLYRVFQMFGLFGLSYITVLYRGFRIFRLYRVL